MSSLEADLKKQILGRYGYDKFKFFEKYILILLKKNCHQNSFLFEFCKNTGCPRKNVRLQEGNPAYKQ